ncbi:MAG: hypothetical protein V4548_05550 [Bacteroidota bacterium]
MTFELFTKRDFSAYFSDTVTFFKLYGKNYFKNYFIINGIFLMILIILIYFISKVYAEILMGGNTLNQNSSYLMDYFNNNFGLVIGIIIVFTLLITILSILNITYPIVYLGLIEKKGNTDFDVKELITALKQNIGRMFLFLLGIIFIITPLMMLVFALLIALCFIIIGFPLILIVLPAFMSWIALSYYEFIIKRVNFFTALGNGLKLLKLQFWTIVGTTFIMLMLVQILQGFITMVPYMVGLFTMFTSTTGMNSEDNMATMAMLMSALMVVSTVLSYFFNNFLIVNQGLIYYSLREENEETKSISQIDLIGTDFE